MALHAALTHRTEYNYDRLTGLAPHTIRLRPAPHCRTPILSYSLRVEPALHFVNWQQDPFGNFLARLVFPERTERLSVTVDLVVDLAVINPFDFFLEDSAQKWPFEYETELAAELAPYLLATAGGPLLDRYMARLDRTATGTSLDYICDLNRSLSQEINYLIRMEPGVQLPDETLKLGSGSCRDSSWLLVQILRRLGLAARFVSGYLIQLKPDVKSLDGPSGTDKDFTDLHAWAEVYLPGAGWIGLDPTSGLVAGEGHIPLAATPSPSSAAPISGAHDEAEVAFDFAMSVTRIRETPRVTLPYSDAQWAEIVAAGDTVDERLRAGDVRLSMGGEPTFVAIDDMNGAEWNNAAVGPTKQRYAEDLIRRLAARFAPGGIHHYGQGKWYPGEQLPRWSYAVHWRTDGEPLWIDPDLIDREQPRAPVRIEDAERYAAQLCANLGLPTDAPIAAFEDPGHFALVEQKLPLGVDPVKNKLDDPAERARLVAVFGRGLSKPTGYVLPIQVWQTQDKGRRWVTERWKLRRERLYLAPGDSPVGFRLPLGSLPYLAPINYPNVEPADPYAPREQLPDRLTLQRQRRTVALQSPQSWPDVANEVIGSVRTALVVEPRDGHLCIFLPPVEDAEDYAALVAALEVTAEHVGLPVRLEGYAPPPDPRLNVIKVTPDPGVIEVNIQPTTDWPSLVAVTTVLYEEARQARLGTEKFMLDGRHTGTGGGNHIVLGGKTPADSPFLRRPDLLASVINYWQNHPSLSYLFSGLFIGPTSQAPRIDEARHDQLYEMEIALAQVQTRSGSSNAGACTPPWLVDRIFRNLLIDVSGNTHRAEICIDKLYSPDSPTGRLGLVEFRSFEMPPHAHMSFCSATAGARADRVVLGDTLQAAAGQVGHGPARSVHASAFRMGGFQIGHRRPQRGWLSLASRVVRTASRVPFPRSRRHRTGRRRGRDPAGAGAMARARRGGRGRRYGTVRGQLARAGRSACEGANAGAAHDHLQRPRATALFDRHVRRGGGGRSLPGMAAGFDSAPDHRHPCAADLRYRRHLVGPLGRGLPLSRGASRRSRPRGVPGQRVRGGRPASVTVRGHGPHTWNGQPESERRAPGLSAHLGPEARRLSGTVQVRAFKVSQQLKQPYA